MGVRLLGGYLRTQASEQLGIEDAAVEIKPPVRRVSAAVPLVRVERAAREAMPMVVRSDVVAGDAELFHSDGNQPIQWLGVAVGEVLGVIFRLGGDVDTGIG